MIEDLHLKLINSMSLKPVSNKTGYSFLNTISGNMENFSNPFRILIQIHSKDIVCCLYGVVYLYTHDNDSGNAQNHCAICDNS